MLATVTRIRKGLIAPTDKQVLPVLKFPTSTTYCRTSCGAAARSRNSDELKRSVSGECMIRKGGGWRTVLALGRAKRGIESKAPMVEMDEDEVYRSVQEGMEMMKLDAEATARGGEEELRAGEYVCRLRHRVGIR